MEKNTKTLIITVGVTLLLIIGTVTASFAFFTISKKQETANIFNSGCLNISIENESNAITLNKTYPITDLEGLELTGYTFTIKNTCSTSTNYMINLESLNETTNTLDTNYIKTSLSSDTMDNLIQKLNSNMVTQTYIENAYISHNLYNGTIEGNTTKEFNLKLWMDYDTTVSQGTNKTYTSKINVIANPDLEVNSTPEVKTTLVNNTLQGTITGSASSAKYCTSSDNICTPSSSTSISSNKINIELNRSNDEIVCINLNDGKAVCKKVEKLLPITVDDIIAEANAKSTKITNFTNINNDTTYPFSYDNNGTFTSTNKVNNKKSTITFNIEENVNNVAICYEVSSELGYDKALFYVDNEEKVSASGEDINCEDLGNITPSNTIKVEYSKDSHTSEGNDEVKFYLINDGEINQTSDGMYNGTTYYWRGEAPTNHVIFANKCWRIVRINGDKTLRLIYNGDVLANNTCFGNGENANSIAVTNQVYNSSVNDSSYLGWSYTLYSNRPSLSINSNTGLTVGGTDSNAKVQTEIWYTNNLESYKDKIANGKFCNYREFHHVSAGYSNVDDYSHGSTFSCPNEDVYTLKVGAITVDEVSFAGGTWESNTSYYLYNGQNYWTMSPGHYDYDVDTGVMFYVGSTGDLNWNDGSYGLRPVINLKADTTFASGGTGTQSNPYVVS